MYPFLKPDDKEIFLKSVDSYIEKYNDNKKLLKLSEYFHKSLSESNFLDFDLLEDYKIKYRTNNQMELFHKSLNQIIENSHPKI